MGEIENTEKLWADTVKLLLVLKLYRPEHIDYLCELGLVETLLSAFSREDKKSVSSVIKLLSGLTHSPQICVRMIDTSGVKIIGVLDVVTVEVSYHWSSLERKRWSPPDVNSLE